RRSHCRRRAQSDGWPALIYGGSVRLSMKFRRQATTNACRSDRLWSPLTEIRRRSKFCTFHSGEATEGLTYKTTNYLATTRLRLLLVLIICSLLYTTFSATANALPQRTRPRPAQPKTPPKSQPKLEAPSLTPQETLDRVRASSDQSEKIALLEKLLATNPAEPYNLQARELLMREYALKGEQMLREANPKAATQAFKSAFRAAPAVINDKIFGQYIFP